jgi:isopenicillin N synthase-like dioxygenase
MEQLPPFPHNVPNAPIARVSHEKLLASDDAEGSRVLEAGQTDGFFYLDMTRFTEGQQLLKESEALLALA